MSYKTPSVDKISNQYPLGINDKLGFGSYKHSTIGGIIDDDPTYLEWALDEVDNFELSDRAHELLTEALGQSDPLETLI